MIVPAMESEHSIRFFGAISGEPLLQPVDACDPAERRLWRACEACCFGEYRIGDCLDPRGLDEDAIDRLASRVLAQGERITDPADESDTGLFWILDRGKPIGTVALWVQELGMPAPSLEIASLYLFREHRRLGHGQRVMGRLVTLAQESGLGAVRLNTEWLWQPAVRFYLDTGWWVQSWKHALRFVRRRGLPGYSVKRVGDRMDFLVVDDPSPLISATRRGRRLHWQERRASGKDDGRWLDLIWSARTTLSLWLAVAGWPLIRSDTDWANAVNWIDLGMPEGLARRLQVFEAFARRDGFRVDTPRIPGLDYPDL